MLPHNNTYIIYAFLENSLCTASLTNFSIFFYTWIPVSIVLLRWISVCTNCVTKRDKKFFLLNCIRTIYNNIILYLYYSSDLRIPQVNLTTHRITINRNSHQVLTINEMKNLLVNKKISDTCKFFYYYYY